LCSRAPRMRMLCMWVNLACRSEGCHGPPSDPVLRGLWIAGIRIK
jgi:hypothetical protein